MSPARLAHIHRDGKDHFDGETARSRRGLRPLRQETNNSRTAVFCPYATGPPACTPLLQLIVSNHGLEQRLIVPMSRDFYRVVFCAFAIRENEGTLNVMGRACTRYIGDLSKSRQATILKAWHVHGNALQPGRDFYPNLPIVGKGLWVSQKVAHSGCSGGLQIDQPSLFPRALLMGLSLIGRAAAEIAQLFCEAGGE